MENPEEVLQSLDEFAKLKPKDIPRELEEYLMYVAKTGDPVYQWSLVKCLFREKMMSVITDFYESCPSIDLPPCPNVDPFNYETMKASLLERLDSFANAPFTVQRLCELLTTPRKEYTRVDKFMRAIEKNILVVSTKEPGGSRAPRSDPAGPEFLMNGVMDGRGLDIGEAIETVSSDGVNLMHEAAAAAAAVAAAAADSDMALPDGIRVDDMEMEESTATEVAVAAAAAAWDKPIDADCGLKPDAVADSTAAAEPEAKPPVAEDITEPAAPADFTPEVFGQPVEPGVETVSLVLATTSEHSPEQQPAPQMEESNSQLQHTPEETLPPTPVIVDIQSSSTEHPEPIPAQQEPETEEATSEEVAGTAPAPQVDPDPADASCSKTITVCGDTPDEINTGLEGNIAEESNVEISSGMLKSDSLLKSLEEFADNLSGLEGATTPPFSELTTDEDTQDAVRGGESMDGEEDSSDEKSEEKPITIAETVVDGVDSSSETRMEVDEPVEDSTAVKEQLPLVTEEEEETEVATAESIEQAVEEENQVVTNSVEEQQPLPPSPQQQPEAAAIEPPVVDSPPAEEPPTPDTEDKPDVS